MAEGSDRFVEVLRQLCQDGPNFPWCFDFPEPGLNEALQELKDGFEDETFLKYLRNDLPAMYCQIIYCARNLFEKYNVPLDEIDERFERMGMGRYYQLLIKPTFSVSVKYGDVGP